MNHRWRMTLIAACLAGAAIVRAGPSAEATPRTLADRSQLAPARSPESQPVQELAAAKMVEEYGIDLGDARAQIAAQDDANRTSQLLERLVPADLWAGSYIDRAQGGTLAVLVTGTTLLPTVGLPVRVRIESVDRSLPELRKVQQRVEDAAAAQGLAVMVSTDIRSNQVQLRPVGVEGAAQAAQIAALADAQQGAAVVAEGIDGMRAAACSVTYQWCDAPLRGGIAMRSASGTNCTAGFIVRSLSDDKPYVLTAGHCLEASGSGTWHTKKPANAPTTTNIGARHNWEYGTATGSTLDTGILTITDATGWAPEPWVLVQASSSTTLDPDYDLQGVGTTGGLAQFSYLCTTGASSGTRCGQYLASGVTGLDGVTGTAWVSFTTCDGDSGGPVFKSHLGYGIVHASIGTQTATTLDTGLGGSFAGYCGTSSLYQGLTSALSAMNVGLDT